MKTTTLAPTLSLLAALVLALSLALACGDDDGGDNPAGSNGDGDTLSGYFTDLQIIFADAEAATNEVEGPLNDTPPDAPLDVQLSTFDTYLGEIDAIFSEMVGRLEDLSVPAAAADGHQGFIDGVSASVIAGNALRDDLTNITTREQYDGRMDKFAGDVNAPVNKTAAACLALQEIADTEEIDIDLDCED